MKCDELKQVEYPIEWGLYYDKAEVDEAIAELKKKLMPCLNGDCILTCEVVEKYGKENAELKQKLEDVQALHYAEMVDAGMRERRLRRSLWLAMAERAMAEVYSVLNDVPTSNRWIKARDRLETKAEEYK